MLAIRATVGVIAQRMMARAFRSNAVSCLTRRCVKNDMRSMLPNDPKLSHAGWKPGIASTKNDENKKP